MLYVRVICKSSKKSPVLYSNRKSLPTIGVYPARSDLSGAEELFRRIQAWSHRIAVFLAGALSAIDD